MRTFKLNGEQKNPRLSNSTHVKIDYISTGFYGRCNDCKKDTFFDFNEEQDPFYYNGVRLRECLSCGRYEGD